jgi:hypothetical protein
MHILVLAQMPKMIKKDITVRNAAGVLGFLRCLGHCGLGPGSLDIGFLGWYWLALIDLVESFF